MTSIDDHASNFFLKRVPPKVSQNVGPSHEGMRLVQSDVGVYKSKLELIFKTARACVSIHLHKDRWIILTVEHFKLVDRFLTPEDLEYIYDQKPGVWNFECFISALWDVAIRKYVDRAVSGGLKIVQKKSLEQKLKEDQEKAQDGSDTVSSLGIGNGSAKEVNALRKLLSIMFESPICSAYLNEVPLMRWNETKAVERVFYVHERVLKRLFHLYAKELDPHADDDPSLPSAPSRGKALPYIVYQKFIKFCTDFRFYPDRLDGLALQRIFSTFDDRKDPTKFCLNFRHFWDALIRLALIYYGQSSSMQDAKPEDKLLAFFDECRPQYSEIFGHGMEEDLEDLSRIKTPNIYRIEPASATSAGQVLVTIRGEYFDPRLGDVVMRIGAQEDIIHEENSPTHPEDLTILSTSDNVLPSGRNSRNSTRPTGVVGEKNAPVNEGDGDDFQNGATLQIPTPPPENILLLPCQYISWGEVRCRMPPIHETGLKLRTFVKSRRDPRNKDMIHVEVSNKTSFHVRLSNDSVNYSPINSEPVVFTYIDIMEPFTIDPAIIKPLQKIFLSYCQFEEPRNKQFLTVTKWRMLKHEMSKVKQLMLPKFEDVLRSSNMDRGELVKRMRAFTSGDDLVRVREDGTYEVIRENLENHNSPEFFIFAQQRMLRLLVTFDDFVRMLVYFVLFTVEELHPMDFLLELAAHYNDVLSKSSTTASVLSLEMIAKIEKELSLIQVYDHRALDVYSGPVLVGTIRDRPGYVQRVGETIHTAHKHKLWSYIHYDSHTQNTIMNILEFSASFDHFIHRILKEGFDIAGVGDPSTRRLLGRSWIIVNPINNEKVGIFWDYPGTIAHLNWIPLPRQIDRPFTLMVNKESDFFQLYRIFQRSQTISELRDLLTRSEYKIKTTLYQF